LEVSCVSQQLSPSRLKRRFLPRKAPDPDAGVRGAEGEDPAHVCCAPALGPRLPAVSCRGGTRGQWGRDRCHGCAGGFVTPVPAVVARREPAAPHPVSGSAPCCVPTAELPWARRVGWAGRARARWAAAASCPGGLAGVPAPGKGPSSPGNKSCERCWPGEASQLCFPCLSPAPAQLQGNSVWLRRGSSTGQCSPNWDF